MNTNINIANERATISAAVDANFSTADNLIHASGNFAGSAVFNLGGTIGVIDSFAGGGATAYNIANNQLFVADGSTFGVLQNGAIISLTSLGDTNGFLSVNDAGFGYTPVAGDGFLGISVTKDNSTFNLALDGTGTFNIGGNGYSQITIPKDFSLNFAASTYGGLPIYGTLHGDGVNDVYSTIVNESQIFLSSGGFVGGNLNLNGTELNNLTFSGAIALDPINGGITFAQGANLGVDIGTRHINLTATDTASGNLSFGANGLTFSTAGGDGGLILSVTENGITRSTLLNVSGTINYALDGSITLEKGTVVQNIFEDGNELTITANTDASGAIVLNETGLNIAPATPDALNIALVNDGFEVADFSSITGVINYDSGIITASDGAMAHLRIYDTWETELRTTGGTASIQFLADRTIYASNGDATFVLDYLDGSTVEIQHGTYSDIYETEISDAIELISAGSNFKGNDDEFIFTLETAGNYTLNGINVVTTADNVQVQLTNYDTIIVNGLSYTPLAENAALALDNTGVIYSTGNFAVGLATSDDLAGDFLPNYDADFANALQLTDSGSIDTLSEILPAENLGEINFNTPDELSAQQIIIAPEN